MDDDIAEFLRSLQTAGVAHCVFVGYVRLFTKLTRSGFDVLLSQYAANVRWHQAVLLHHVGLQPDTHRISLYTRALHVAHTLDTLDGWDNINIAVVGEELVVIASVGGQGEHHHLRRLALHDRDTDTCHLGRQKC